MAEKADKQREIVSQLTFRAFSFYPGEEPIVSIVLDNGPDDASLDTINHLISKGWTTLANPLLGAFGFVFVANKEIAPILVADNVDRARAAVRWLSKVVEKKSYTLQFILLKKNGDVIYAYASANPKTIDFNLIQNVINKIKEIIKGKTSA